MRKYAHGVCKLYMSGVFLMLNTLDFIKYEIWAQSLDFAVYHEHQVDGHEMMVFIRFIDITGWVVSQ